MIPATSPPTGQRRPDVVSGSCPSNLPILPKKHVFFDGKDEGESVTSIKSTDGTITKSRSNPLLRSWRLAEVAQDVCHRGRLTIGTRLTTAIQRRGTKRPGCSTGQERTPPVHSRQPRTSAQNGSGMARVLARARRRRNVCVSSKKRPPISPAKTTNFARPPPPASSG